MTPTSAPIREPTGFPWRAGSPRCVLLIRKPASASGPTPITLMSTAAAPHGAANATADIDGGKMDGFVAQAVRARKGCTDANNPACTNSRTPDVMGYHTQFDIPNYWAYARNFVLQDHMFEPNASWSLPSHLFLVSAWSAHCTQHDNPASCTNALQSPGNPPDFAPGSRRAGHQPVPSAPSASPSSTPSAPSFSPASPAGHTAAPLGGIAAGGRRPAPIYAWTDLTYLLHQHHVSWGYYVVAGTEPDCENDSAVSCAPVNQNAKTPGIWNPAALFRHGHR